MQQSANEMYMGTSTDNGGNGSVHQYGSSSNQYNTSFSATTSAIQQQQHRSPNNSLLGHNHGGSAVGMSMTMPAGMPVNTYDHQHRRQPQGSGQVEYPQHQQGNTVSICNTAEEESRADANADAGVISKQRQATPHEEDAFKTRARLARTPMTTQQRLMSGLQD
jgi:hypothetical protein